MLNQVPAQPPPALPETELQMPLVAATRLPASATVQPVRPRDITALQKAVCSDGRAAQPARKAAVTVALVVEHQRFVLRVIDNALGAVVIRFAIALGLLGGRPKAVLLIQPAFPAERLVEAVRLRQDRALPLLLLFL